MWSNVKRLNFALTKSAINMFNHFFHADRKTIDMKHIKRELSFEGLGLILWANFMVGPRRKINIFQNVIMVYIKGNKTYGNKHANSFHLHTLLTPGMGSKGQNSVFKVVMLYKTNENEVNSNMLGKHNFALTLTLNPRDGVKGQKTFF